MKIFFSILLITLVGSCQLKLSHSFYSTSYNTNDSESRDLYLFENGKYYLRAFSDSNGFRQWGFSIGTYIKINDTLIQLTSAKKYWTIDTTIQKSCKDSMYSIDVVNSKDPRITPEDVELIINEIDTMSSVAFYALHYDSANPFIKTIRVYFPEIKYVSEMRKISAECNTIVIRFTGSRYNYHNDFITIENYSLLLINDSIKEVLLLREGYRKINYPFIYNGNEFKYGFWEETSDKYQYDYIFSKKKSNN